MSINGGQVGISDMVLGRSGQGGGSADRQTILISANAFWNISNFRAGLIRQMVANGHHVVIAAPDADPKWTEAMGAEALNIAIDRSGINPISDAMLLFDYYKLFRRTCPNIFLGFTPKPNIYGSMAASARGVRAVPNVSGLGTAFINPGPLAALVGALYRIAFHNCPVIFFQNPDDSDLFIRRKIVRQEQVRLLPGSGVDLLHFSPAAPQNGIRFLFVGRLLGDKGAREFVEAARLLRPRHPDWRFQLLGSLDPGNRTAISQAELDRWIADGIIEHIGQVEDVRPFIAAATAVVLPSYREGLPRSLLEAAAMARPIIASDVPGNRQVVQQGVNGLLCAARESSGLAIAIETMAGMDENSREAMGQAGRAMVEREFGESRVIEAYLDVLRQFSRQRGS